MSTFRQSGKLKAVTFSYDDGVTQDIRLIELLNKYGLKCTFNLNSELLGKPGILQIGEQRIAHYKVSSQDVKHIYDGHEVAVHTLTHPMLPAQTDEEIIRQVERDRENLSELVGYNVVGMAYPGGGINNDERVAAVIQEHTGVKYCRTIESSHSFTPQSNLYRFNPTVSHLEWDELAKRTEEFVSADANTPQIFYVWGHSYEMDLAPDYWQKLEAIFARIANQKDIFYGTNTEVLL